MKTIIHARNAWPWHSPFKPFFFLRCSPGIGINSWSWRAWNSTWILKHSPCKTCLRWSCTASVTSSLTSRAAPRRNWASRRASTKCPTHGVTWSSPCRSTWRAHRNAATLSEPWTRLSKYSTTTPWISKACPPRDSLGRSWKPWTSGRKVCLT